MTDRTDQFLAAAPSSAVPLVAFLLVVCCVVLLYLMYGADSDGPADVYVAGRTVRPVANGFALAGDHISLITLMTTTGLVALSGYDGMALAMSIVGSLGVLLILAHPLRNVGQFTLGDTLGARFPGSAARIAGTVATLCFCLPLIVVQLVVAERRCDLPDGTLRDRRGCTGLHRPHRSRHDLRGFPQRDAGQQHPPDNQDGGPARRHGGAGLLPGAERVRLGREPAARRRSAQQPRPRALLRTEPAPRRRCRATPGPGSPC